MNWKTLIIKNISSCFTGYAEERNGLLINTKYAQWKKKIDLNKWSEISTLWKKPQRRWKDNEDKGGSNFLFISSFIRKVWNGKFYTLKTLQGNVWKFFWFIQRSMYSCIKHIPWCPKCAFKNRFCLLHIWLLLKTKQATRVQKIKAELFGCNLDFLTKRVRKCSIHNDK